MQLNDFSVVLLYVPCFALLLCVLRRYGMHAWATPVLIVASLVFYASNGVANLLLLAGSLVTNWSIGQLVGSDQSDETRRRWLALGLLLNISMLVVFKLPREAVSSLGIVVPSSLPLGLSFFTITQVMYLIDCYERLIPSQSLGSLIALVSYFPNITAGPILRTRTFLRQIENVGSTGTTAEGAALIVLGLLKKQVLGDGFARVAKVGYEHLSSLSTPEAWLTAMSSTMEIYYDFSGYSDIAVGISLLFGLSLTRNFNAPFRSTNISDFWRRWHISLSDFITTYLYTPVLRQLGKPTLARSAVASVAAMVIAGLWHGLTWNYALFGLAHGAALASYQYWKRLKRPLPRTIATGLTLLFVTVVFITVKTPNVHGTWQMLALLAGRSPFLSFHHFSPLLTDSAAPVAAIVLVFGTVLSVAGKTSDELAKSVPAGFKLEMLIVGALLVVYAFSGGGAASDFRYRQF